jgi:hypothetical protein
MSNREENGQPRMKYSDLPTGNFFVIAAVPTAGEFFKCQPWVSVTADLEKLFCPKPGVEVIVTNRNGKVNR